MTKNTKVAEAVGADPIEVVNKKAKELSSPAFRRMMDKMESWKPAAEVLSSVRAVPTIFPQFDFVNRIGGLPLERVTVVTGPSNHGKSAFGLGLCASFVQKGHLAGFEDAENTTTIDWSRELMRSFADDPRFLAMRPSTYEDAVEATTRFCNNIAEAREAGDLPPETSGLVVVDSLRKLVPAKIMKMIEQETLKGGIDGMNGRAGQIKALFNSSWLDQLVPLMSKTGCAIVLITREGDDGDADPWDKKTDHAYKITGGKALIYESSLLLRITRAAWVTNGKEGKENVVYGEKHKITIVKTKVGGKDVREPVSYFHTSNGALILPGFDRARDVIDLGIQLKVVEQSGSWYSFANERLGQGVNQAVEKLTGNPELLEKVEASCREQFGKQ